MRCSREAKECSIYHSCLVAATGTAGAVAAIIATSATIGAIAITAGLFAAPALAVGGLTFLTLAMPIPHGYLNIRRYFLAQALSFALLSGAVIAAGLAFGILSMPLVITFAVVAAVVTVAILGKATHEFYKEWKRLKADRFEANRLLLAADTDST